MRVPTLNAAASDRSDPAAAWPSRRTALVAAILLALAVAGTAIAGTPAAEVEPDLARILRFMGALKLLFAALAFAVAWFRLARPAGGWRRLAYLGGPPLAAGGAVLLLSLHHPAVAALSLHGGLLAVLAAALTDADFFASRGSAAARANAPR